MTLCSKASWLCAHTQSSRAGRDPLGDRDEWLSGITMARDWYPCTVYSTTLYLQYIGILPAHHPPSRSPARHHTQTQGTTLAISRVASSSPSPTDLVNGTYRSVYRSPYAPDFARHVFRTPILATHPPLRLYFRDPA